MPRESANRNEVINRHKKLYRNINTFSHPPHSRPHSTPGLGPQRSDAHAQPIAAGLNERARGDVPEGDAADDDARRDAVVPAARAHAEPGRQVQGERRHVVGRVHFRRALGPHAAVSGEKLRAPAQTVERTTSCSFCVCFILCAL